MITRAVQEKITPNVESRSTLLSYMLDIWIEKVVLSLYIPMSAVPIEISIRALARPIGQQTLKHYNIMRKWSQLNTTISMDGTVNVYYNAPIQSSMWLIFM
jgi:hypothetical protein